MGYFYAAMWLIAGFILIFSLAKEHKVFYFAGGFFLLLGAWWLADAFVPEDLFAGGWGVALRIVTLAALIIVSVVFFIERQRIINKEAAEMKKKAEQQAKEPETVDSMNAGPGDDQVRASVAGVNIMRPQSDDEEEKEEE